MADRARVKRLLHGVLDGRNSVDTFPWHVAVNVVGGSFLVSEQTRGRIYRAMGLDCRTNAIHPRCWFFSANIEIGEGVWIGQNAYFDCRERISIGARAGISPHAKLITANHELGGSERRAGPYRPAPIVVEEGAWVGAGTIVLSGVTVGRGAVVASGSVLSRDCEPDTLYGGVPAKRIRALHGSEQDALGRQRAAQQ